MKKILLVGALCSAVAACASPQQTTGTAAGATAGAIVGGPVGAVVGAGIGAAATAPQQPQTVIVQEPRRRSTRR